MPRREDAALYAASMRRLGGGGSGAGRHPLIVSSGSRKRRPSAAKNASGMLSGTSAAARALRHADRHRSTATGCGQQSQSPEPPWSDVDAWTVICAGIAKAGPARSAGAIAIQRLRPNAMTTLSVAGMPARLVQRLPPTTSIFRQDRIASAIFAGLLGFLRPRDHARRSACLICEVPPLVAGRRAGRFARDGTTSGDGTAHGRRGAPAAVLPDP